MIKPLNEFCPRFDSCNVNNCPLFKGKYKSSPFDKQTKCPLSSARRRTINNKYVRAWIDTLPEKDKGIFTREKILEMARNEDMKEVSKENE